MRRGGWRAGGGSSGATILALVVLGAACGSKASPSATAASGAGGGKGSSTATNGPSSTAGPGGSSSTQSSTSSASSASSSGTASTAGLRLFFSDLESGPSSGGENGKGAYVTLYGVGFGASRGSSTVTIGGGAADNYPLWTDTKITFQLGAAAATGDMVVVVPPTGSSNALPFTVRAGNIYFVTSTGDDKAAGTFAAPWATIPQAKNKIAAGDIAYIGTKAGDSVSQTTVDASSPYKCALGMSTNDGTNAGTAAAPKALVVYPGATGTIGVESGIERGLLVPAISGTFDYWVIAGFTLRGETEALELEGPANGWRVVGNDISCPNGTGETGCVTGGDSTSPTNLKFYGNRVHDAATTAGSITKYYHGIYFGSNDLELGWNVVENGKTCRAIQFHDTGGPNNYGLSVHDNIIHDTVCDGIVFGTIDPSQGKVEAYNNLIYNVGLGPDPGDGAADYAGIYVSGETDSGNDGTGAVQIYNNTLYNCGSWASSDSGAFNNGGQSPMLSMHLVNNLVYAVGSEDFLAKDSTAGLIDGSNNLWFGAGAAPAATTANVTMNPMLMNATAYDFRLLAGSPAIGAGIPTSALFDFQGTPRGSSFDIGAYQHTP